MIIQNVGHYARMKKRFTYIYGKNFDPWNIEYNLPFFIEAEMTKPILGSVKTSWPEHVRGWVSSSMPHFVRYEEMLADSEGTLAKLLSEYVDQEVDLDEVRYTVKRYSFENKTGRQRGEEDRSSFARKGISGDWKNYFNAEARQIFDHYAGDLLIELGYEKDHSWVEKS